MAKTGKQLHFADRAKWRAWLQTHHAAADELWLIFYKKHTGRAGVTRDAAVEEALCFGWIDGLLKRLDEARYVVRFTPRRANSLWSQINKKRVADMIEQRRMTEAGLARVEAARANGQWDKMVSPPDAASIPAEMVAALAKNKPAQAHFEALAPSYRRQFIGWIASGKRTETRQKRSAEAVRLLAEGKKRGMK